MSYNDRGSLNPDGWMLLAVVLTLLWTLWWLGVATHAAERRVSVQIAHGAVVCRIPRDRENRWMNVGLSEYFSHGFQLDGLPSDPITTEAIIPALDCEGAEEIEGFCEVFYGAKGFERAVAHAPCQ